MTVLCALALVGCTKDNINKTPEWDFGEEEQQSSDTSVTTAQKYYYLWVDASANFEDYANSPSNIQRDMKLAADAGFTDIVVDVRPTNGNILYKSSTGIPLKWVGAWLSSGYGKVQRTADFDYLQTFIDYGHQYGLRIHAGFNTMVGGNSSGLGNSGLLYEDSSKRDWACVLNLSTGLCNTMDNGNYTTKFLNPANESVQKYLIQLLKDLAAYKDLDGIVLDRCRYTGLDGDFSEASRKQFASYIGTSTFSWPSDILPAGADYEKVTASGFKKPKYYKKWLEFRAKVIHDFVESASDAVHKVNPDIKFGVYVGGWYSQYYDVGVNWASPNYSTSTYYSSWATSDYHKYGYADHCDHILIGAYANPSAVYGTGEWTMQGFCALAKGKIGTSCPIVVGGPDVGNWDCGGNHYSTTCTSAVTNSVKACSDACNGYFCFDIIHVKWYDYWQYLKAGIAASEAK